VPQSTWHQDAVTGTGSVGWHSCHTCGETGACGEEVD